MRHDISLKTCKYFNCTRFLYSVTFKANFERFTNAPQGYNTGRFVSFFTK